MKRSLRHALMMAGVSSAAAGLLLAPATTPAFAADTTTTTQMAMPTPPSTMAASAVLMDADNGQILYAKNADARRAPASTTKLMTMLLVFKAVKEGKLSWSDIIPITPDAYQVATEPGVSDAYLDPKEKFTLDDMMKFVAILSANDATVAVADKVAGDQDTFVQMMNDEAKTIGLTGTHYMNVDGLPQDNHYTTAMDLAKLAQYIVTNYPDMLKYTSLPSIQVRSTTQSWPNTDELIGHYDGVDGLKTGFTNDAGYCYVGTAKQNGVRLISVVMGDTTNNIHQRFIDSAKLFDYGFHFFKETNPLQQGQKLSTTLDVPNGKNTSLDVMAKDSLVVDLPDSVKGNLNINLNQDMTAPITKGQKVGTAEYKVNGQVIAQTDLVAAEDDGKANWFIRLMRSIGRGISNLLHKL